MKTNSAVKDEENARSSRRARQPRKTRTRTIWRLELRCGHTAFGLAAEPHREGLVRPCYPCGGYVRILVSTPTMFKIPHEEPSRRVNADEVA